MPFFVSMPRFCHLIFDLDGTLVDTRADLAAAANYMLAQLGLPIQSVEQVAGYIGQGARVLVERVLGPQHAHLTSAGFEIFMQFYGEHLVDQSVVYSGLDQVLAAAQSHGLVLSVLTNKPAGPSRAILSGLGLTPFFGHVVGGDSLAVKKPDPHGVWFLQRVTRLPLAETLLIGDSAIDVQTGRAAGLAICGVGWGFDADGMNEQRPDFVVDSPAELLDVILA